MSATSDIVRTAVFGVLVLLLCSVPCASADDEPVRLRTQPQAGFQITPLMHHIEARAGQSVPFSFDVRTRGEDTSLRIRLVGLAQSEDGRIHVSERAVPDGIRLETPEEITVKRGEANSIHGRILVPLDTNYVIFGIQVTDAGRPLPANEADEAEQTQRRAQVRFVTQYLLRVEVRIHGGQGASVADLRVFDGGLTDRGGFAVARMYVENSTPTAVAFEAQARLIRSVGDDAVPLGPYFSLHHPARANEPEARRRQVRVMGGSRIALEALVPEPIFEGTYKLEIRLVGPAQRAGHVFDVTVSSNEFAAQHTVVARIVNSLHVTPSALELSSARGGTRMTSVQIHNVGTQNAQLRVAMLGDDGDSGAGVVVRPSGMSLAPGQRRNLAVTMTHQPRDAGARYLLLRVEVEPDDGGAGGLVQIPVAINVPADAARAANIDDVRWDTAENALAVEISNTGAVHLVLDGQVQLSDTFNRAIVLRGGFGQWLLPGQSTVVFFRPARPPPHGPYDAHLKLDIGPGQAPYTRGAASVVH